MTLYRNKLVQIPFLCYSDSMEYAFMRQKNKIFVPLDKILAVPQNSQHSNNHARTAFAGYSCLFFKTKCAFCLSRLKSNRTIAFFSHWKQSHDAGKVNLPCIMGFFLNLWWLSLVKITIRSIGHFSRLNDQIVEFL